MTNYEIIKAHYTAFARAPITGREKSLRMCSKSSEKHGETIR